MGFEFDGCVLVEDSCAIRQRATVNRHTGSVEKKEWCWCCRRPRKPACSPHGKLCCKGYYRIVLMYCSIRRGWTSVSSDGPNPPIGERVPGRVPLAAKKSVGRPLQIYRRMRKSLITITFSGTCRYMREHPMAIIVSEVGKILMLICRSCVCRQLERVGDLIFSLSLSWPYWRLR